MFKELQDKDILSEMQQISGAGKKFKIGEEEFEVLPATLGQLEEVADLWNEKIHHIIIFNFLSKKIKEDGSIGTADNKESKESLYKILGIAFDNKVPMDKLKKVRRDQVEGILDFFLIS